jgi:hypothetical protein
MGVSNIFNIIIAVPLGPTYKNVYQFICTEQKVPNNIHIHRWVLNMELSSCLPFWHLEFGGGYQINGKFVDR